MKSSNHAEKRASSSAESPEIADSRSSTLITRCYCIGTTRANSRGRICPPLVVLSSVQNQTSTNRYFCAKAVPGLPKRTSVLAYPLPFLCDFFCSDLMAKHLKQPVGQMLTRLCELTRFPENALTRYPVESSLGLEIGTTSAVMERRHQINLDVIKFRHLPRGAPTDELQIGSDRLRGTGQISREFRNLDYIFLVCCVCSPRQPTRFPRVKAEGQGFYQCVSRVVDGRFIFQTAGHGSVEAQPGPSVQPKRQPLSWPGLSGSLSSTQGLPNLQSGRFTTVSLLGFER